MGEYLKSLMLHKLNNPSFRIPYIAKGRAILKRKLGLRPHIRKREPIWKPKEIRHKDLSHMRVKLPEEMSRTEFEEWKRLV